MYIYESGFKPLFLVILNAAAFGDLCCLMKICLAEKRRFVECESVGS